MAKTNKETKGTGMHTTNIRHDNPIVFERNTVIDIEEGSWVYSRARGWGEVVEISTGKLGTTIYVRFGGDDNKKRGFKYPDAFLQGKISQHPGKSY